MFIEKSLHPTIEFDPASDQPEPVLVHFLSNKVDPMKSALPLLAESAEEERVLVVTSPLGELVDETIRLHRHEDYRDMVVVDEKHRAYFAAVRASLARALAKLDQVQFAAMDDEDEQD